VLRHGRLLRFRRLRARFGVSGTDLWLCPDFVVDDSQQGRRRNPDELADAKPVVGQRSALTTGRRESG
jgi:hypothetical protein